MVALALIVVIGSVIFAFISVFQGSERSDRLSSVMAGVALLLLLIQLMVGFPAKKAMVEAIAKENSEVQTGEDEPGVEMGNWSRLECERRAGNSDDGRR